MPNPSYRQDGLLGQSTVRDIDPPPAVEILSPCWITTRVRVTAAPVAALVFEIYSVHTCYKSCSNASDVFKLHAIFWRMVGAVSLGTTAAQKKRQTAVPANGGGGRGDDDDDDDEVEQT